MRSEMQLYKRAISEFTRMNAGQKNKYERGQARLPDAETSNLLA